jgi:hypothetical protein
MRPETLVLRRHERLRDRMLTAQAGYPGRQSNPPAANRTRSGSPFRSVSTTADGNLASFSSGNGTQRTAAATATTRTAAAMTALFNPVGNRRFTE